MATKPVQINIHTKNNINMDRIANKKDDEIIFNSAYKAVSKTENNLTSKTQKMLPYVFIAGTTLISAASTKGALSKKMFEATKTIGTFAVADVISDLFFGTKNKLQNTDNKSKKQNTALPTLLTFIASVATVGIAINSAGKLFNHLIKNNKTINKTTKALAEKIDNGFVSKKLKSIQPKYNEFLNKHKIIANTDKTTKFWALALMLTVSEGLLGIKNSKKRNEIFKDNLTQEVLNRKVAQTIK